MKPEW